MPSSPVNIITLKWGDRYPSSDVNLLYHSVKKNLSLPFRFICVTDDAQGLDRAIEAVDFPKNPGIKNMPWPNVFAKLLLTQDGFANLKGPTLFLDIDLIIMDNIDCFFSYQEGSFCIIHNWLPRRKTLFRPLPRIGNSSVFRFEAGKSNFIYARFLAEMEDATNRQKFRTEQAFLTYSVQEVHWWPQEWVRSFKRHCQRPFPLNYVLEAKKPQTKILVFHGRPDPIEALEGFKGKKIHHYVKPTSWLAPFFTKKDAASNQ